MADDHAHDASPGSKWRAVSFGDLLAGRDDLPDPAEAVEAAKKKSIVKLGRQTKGRRGKGVTTISDLPLDEAGLHELATKLKGLCGCGGTVKDGIIEIQGDQRDRLAKELEKLGYRVKLAGG
jgi:predicted translation initiation factor SUI1